MSVNARDNPLYSRDCKKCGCPLAFVKDARGKTQVLDLRSPVFQIISMGRQDQAISRDDAYVSHFCTCKFANEFSRGGNANEQQANEEVDAKADTES